MIKKILSPLLLLSAAIMWGFAFVAQDKSSEIPPFTLGAARSIIAGVFLILIIIILDKVLKTVQDMSKERVGIYQGKVMDVLVEEMNEQDASLVTGRLSNNTTVHLPGDASMIGQIVDVMLDECHGFYYMGHRV